MHFLVFILLGSLLLHGVLSTPDANPIVHLEQGKVRGYSDTTAKGKTMYVFRGLPFAKPPVEELRFRDPEPADGWSGIRDGTRVYPACIQMDLAPFMKNRAIVSEGSEDCLTLTVYTPEVQDENKRLPVMFYIHGGGYFSGAGNYYEGNEILDGGVVLVAINYRLGVLGFLSTEDDEIPGNFGLKDQIMAMKWVQRNIRKFGGDPDNVTIFGQSAGGGSSSAQLMIPSSKGLFSRAIAQSGASVCDWAFSKGHRDHALQVGALMGCFPSSEYGARKSKRLLQCLQKADARQLALSITNFMVTGIVPLTFVPRVDGKFIPDHPAALLRDGKHHLVDLMIGTTKHEGGFLMYNYYENDKDREQLEKNFDIIAPVILGVTREEDPVGLSKKMFERYLGGTDIAGKHQEFEQMAGDRLFHVCSSVLAQHHTDNVRPHGKKVYSYMYTHKGENSAANPVNTDLDSEWVNHMEEIVTMFPSGQSSRSAADSKVRDYLVTLWTNFAKFGNPTPDNSLGFVWEPTNKDNRFLEINLNPSMRDDVKKEAREFFQSLGISEFNILKGSQRPRDEL